MMTRRPDIPAIWWGWLVAASGLTGRTGVGYMTGSTGLKLRAAAR